MVYWSNLISFTLFLIVNLNHYIMSLPAMSAFNEHVNSFSEGDRVSIETIVCNDSLVVFTLVGVPPIKLRKI